MVSHFMISMVIDENATRFTVFFALYPSTNAGQTFVSRRKRCGVGQHRFQYLQGLNNRSILQSQRLRAQ
ncbi:Uncharacterised protein [Vibrio cholerae]|uniref:Uncharacterized protein n=1 Tax=Vibrio cholerae TaxID=666 RepID=A0A655ZL57_VIBCL|nr:Uncharacterised protein [Vibrio cholerae]CSC72994.1 Uncharacterised protein [Vibrio cholerae]CSC84104.1 Uncharacterised protein [Vibrio cholerae]CSD30380.1 Uncharacterised protein [Vibrio cholerae]